MKDTKTEKPLNVVLIVADQMRADCVGCYGNDLIRTPNIDRLSREGTTFRWAFAQHPQCLPSRSSFHTGRYCHENGAISNHVGMAADERTLGEYMQDEGYSSSAIGKVHIFPTKTETSFDQTVLCGGQNSDAVSPDVLHEDYKNWIKANGFWEALQKTYEGHASKAYRENFQALPSQVPAEAYIDCWVGDQCVERLNSLPEDEPFFLFASFPNPHNPFEPPEPYASLYDPESMPIPRSFHSDLSDKPPQQLAYKRHGRKNIGSNYEHLDIERLQRVMAYYYASITLVDDQVGKILKTIEENGLSENTCVIFMSDHGELLGHHGMLLKSTDQYPILYDKSLHVPLIIRTPGAPEGVTVDSAVELVDICPTILEIIGAGIPPEVQGQSLSPAVFGGAAPQREFIFAESGAVKMLRGERYKLVYYPGQTYGELYDLEDDSLEMDNLYADASYHNIRRTMEKALLDRLIHMEAPRQGESSKGRAYWRTLYKLPF